MFYKPQAGAEQLTAFLAVAEEGPGIERFVAVAVAPPAVDIVAELMPDIVVRRFVVAAAGPGEIGVYVVAAVRQRFAEPAPFVSQQSMLCSRYQAVEVAAFVALSKQTADAVAGATLLKH